MRKACLNSVYELAKKDGRVIFIGSDLGQGTLDAFKKDLPDRFFMEGISEANIIGMAAGFALNGKVVFVNTIASFLTRRCFEQITIDLCLQNLNVRLIGNGGGLVYAPLGPTHLAIEDIAIMRAIPNMTVVAPCDAEEMKRLIPATLDHKGPIYIRLAKGWDPVVSSGDLPFEIGKGVTYRCGHDALIITTGVMLNSALSAADELEKQGVSVGVLHLHTVKPIDKESILEHSQKVSTIITIEEHSIIGGLGGAVAEIIAEADFDSIKKFRRIAIPDVFPDEYGSQASLLQTYSITTEKLISEIIKNK
ncbi:MAG: transketolase [Proteobacteria bacterium]|nr:transketolase [Pseudomonadota bacterium]